MVASVRLRLATEDDCRLLWRWRNESEVRALAFQSEPIPWEQHIAWFKGKRCDPNCLIYIVEDEGRRPVGQVRFDVKEGGDAETNISIVEELRGRGYGTAALRLACLDLVRIAPVKRIVAYIKPENKASVRMFGKTGFAYRGREKVRGFEAVCMIKDRSDSSGMKHGRQKKGEFPEKKAKRSP